MIITKNILRTLIGATGLLLSVSIVTDVRIGMGIGFIGVVLFGFAAFKKQKNRLTSSLHNSLYALSALIILGTIGYWLVGLTDELYAVIVFLFTLSAIYASRFFTPLNISLRLKKKICVFSIIEFVGYAILLYLLLEKRTGGMLTSVWLQTSYKIFLAFGLLTLYSLIHSWYHKRMYPAVLLVIRYVLLFSVASIVVANGMGFDPFIHQAAEKVIAEIGYIAPKTPFYIGQYVLVQFIHLITGLSIAAIDTALVPTLAGIYLPLLFLTHVKRFTAPHPATIVILASLIPLPFFIFTTPHALSLLLALFCILSLLHKRDHILPSVLALAVTCVHPLIGVPLLLVTGLFHPILQKKYISAALYIGILLAVPIMLLVYGKLSGTGVTLSSIHYAVIPSLLNPFIIPHYFFLSGAPTLLFTLYAYKIVILPIVGVILAFIGYRKSFAPLVKAAIALTFSGVIVASVITIPGVIGYEQLNYAMRLLQLAILSLFPLYLAGIQKILPILTATRFRRMLCLLCATGLLTISWYFTYPTRDAISHYTGFVVRDVDIEAIEKIDEKEHGQYNYIVLSNQVVSAAALHVHGFAKYHETVDGQQFFFPIPTGGPLYEYFKLMVYSHPKREWMVQAMHYAGVKKAYFIHTNYWYPAAEIRDEAIEGADDWFTIDDQIWVYEYALHADE